MAYKEKTCPTCNKTHTKRGPYCSRSCGNSRSFTAEEKANLSAKQIAHMNSDADTAEESKWRVAEIGRFAKMRHQDPINHEKSPDDYNVLPETRIKNNQFVDDGAVWETDE